LHNNIACVCNRGYSEEGEICIRNLFEVYLSINQTNSIKLSFTEPLLNSLENSDLFITLNNVNLTFFIQQADETKYFITPDYLADIRKSSNMRINLDSLVSVNNSLLRNTILVVEPFETSSMSLQQQLKAKINSAKVLADKGALAGLYIILGGSFINLNLVSLFNFISTAEIFYSTNLFELDLDSTLSGFLVGMRIESKLPNIFSYIISQSDGVPIPEKYINYGYSTNLLLLNAGVHLTILFIFIVIDLILLALSLVPYFHTKLKPVLEKFKYSVFLRFWIQTYLDLFLASTIGIRYTKFENSAQIVDFSLCLFVLVNYK
jgi:hypothetical protein